MKLAQKFRDLSKFDATVAGGKGASLGEMTRAGLPVPPGFVITASAFERFIEQTDLNVEIESILRKVDHHKINTIEDASKQIQALILGCKMPQEIAKETNYIKFLYPVKFLAKTVR